MAKNRGVGDGIRMAMVRVVVVVVVVVETGEEVLERAGKGK